MKTQAAIRTATHRQSKRAMRGLAGGALVAVLVAGCAPSVVDVPSSSAFACPKGTSPCGSGCIPNATSVCCDNGSGKTSSYCTNSAGGGCFVNAGNACSAAFPAGTDAAFCCSQNGSIGSNDCPSGQHHCGLQCVPADQPCCPAGSSTADCPETSWDSVSCTLRSASDVGCAVCLSTSVCISCPAGECCAGDPCGGGGCKPSAVCTGAGGPPSGGGSCAGGGLLVSTLNCEPLAADGSCTCYGASSYCLSAAEYKGATGKPLPAVCAPQGTNGCLDPVKGTLVNPCCPGLTCRVCGPAPAVGGTCLP